MDSRTGNKESRAFQKLMGRIADTLVRMNDKIDDYSDEDIYLRGMTIQTPWHGREDYLIILRATIGGQQVVAFSSGETFYEAVKVACERFINRTLKWKEDEYASS